MDNKFSRFYIINIFNIFGFFFVVSFFRCRNFFGTFVKQFSVGHNDGFEIFENTSSGNYTFRVFNIKNFFFSENFFYSFRIISCDNYFIIFVLLYKICNYVNICFKIPERLGIKLNQICHLPVNKII